MSQDHQVLALRLTDGKISPLAWTKATLSKKEIRRATRRFRKDEDVSEGILISWARIYSSIPEMKSEIPEYLIA